ncbi:Aste57867_10507 [Aphanomyces stellatus]|uniref:Aste57867_10507 protein n=1 Tax=Aphanomyces stellatus TaxID=120398 RepID=A0A485KRM9_9STRA|nr:hypothetical protein As57867_010467 [Aphanomyces stellatus]VFT87380.1 Aste57867_10507 [Aphanomyces stellatus]
MDNDLHMKMSKKIAQLTKVIFHLNTKNEDAASELQTTVASHRRETEMLAREAATKMGQLKETLEKREAALKSMENVKKLKERHLKDKADAFAEFERYKTEVRLQQTQLEEHFQGEIETMAGELRKARGSFQDRVAELKSTLEAVQARATHGQADMAAMQLKHTDEVADMVTQSNRKFNDMLTSQLNQQDAMRADFAVKVAALEKAHQLQVHQLTEQAEHEAKLAVRRRELECTSSADSMKSELVSKMERLLSEIEALRHSETNLRGEKSDLQQTVTALRAQCKASEIELQNEKRTATTLAGNADAALADAKSNLSERQNQISMLEDEVAKLRRQVEALEAERRALQDTMDKLHMDHKSTSSSLSDKEKQWTAAVKNLQVELCTAQATLKDRGTEVQKLQAQLQANTKSEDELKTQLLAAQKKIKDMGATLAMKEAEWKSVSETHQGDVNALRGEKAKIEKAAEETQARFAANVASLQAELGRQKAREGELIAEHEKALKQLQQSAQSMSQSQKQEMEAQAASLRAQLAAAQKVIESNEDRLGQLHDQQKQWQGQLKGVQDQVKATEAAAIKDQREWQKQQALHEAERDKAAKQAKKDKEKFEKLENEFKTLKQKTELSARGHVEAVAALKQAHAREMEALEAATVVSLQEAVAKAEATMQVHVDEQRVFLLEMQKSEVAALEAQIERWATTLTAKQTEFDEAWAAQGMSP